MKFAITLFAGNPEHWPAIVQRADALGFHSVWLADHLITPMQWSSEYPYREGGPGYGPDAPIMDTWVTIGHLAGVTKRIMLGSGVFVLPMRNPIATARAVATAQYFSKGRILFGIGTGWLAEEFEAVGEDFKTRGKRTDEIVEILTRLWSGEEVSHSGTFYRFNPVKFSPKPSPHIPLIFGGTTDAALRRTALHGDGWFAPSRPLDEIMAAIRKLEGLRRNAGRDKLPFQTWVRCYSDPTIENIKQHEAEGVRNLTVPIVLGETLQQKLDALEKFAHDVMPKFPLARKK